jgi:putative flippase GtrA
VDFAVFNLLLVPLDGSRTNAVLLANTTAFMCAMVVNYSMNARFSFRVGASRRSLLSYVLFTVVGLLFYNFNLLWIRAALDADTRLLLNVSKAAAMALLFAWNYVGYSRFVFRADTSPAPERRAVEGRR